MVIKDLMDIKDLKPLLGYSDIRSVRSFCKKNALPLIILGRKTYVAKKALEDHIIKKLPFWTKNKVFKKSHDNNRKLNSKKSNLKLPRIKGIEQIHSEAANDLIKAINTTKF
jgi:hypothetical protein